MSDREQLGEPIYPGQNGRLSRRALIKGLMMLGLSAGTASALAACVQPTAPAAPTAAGASGPAATTPASAATAGAAKKGGTLRRGWQPPTQLDPALQATSTEIAACAQMYDWLVWIDEKNQPSKALAESWGSNKEGTQWTFALRQGVTFHSGKALTAEDVVFTFNRLRDKSIGAATASLYENIKDVKAVDGKNVQFVLAKANPELPADLGDYHAAIVASDTKDFKTTYNGTGPFILEKFSPEDRATFKRNPNYWLSDLPYLDGIQDIYSPQQSAQVEALRGGQLDVVMGLGAELAETLKKEGKTTILQGRPNMHFALHMRSDRKPGSDPKVRQALKAATDRSAILKAARLGYGVAGRDTPISPVFGDYYLDVPEPKRDVAKARQLLKEAGYDSLNIQLTAQNSFDVPKIAVVWKEQLAEAGVNVDIKVVPPDVYYQDDGWLQVDFGITEWALRATPQPYLQLAYKTGAKWNESHFSDAELDQLADQAASELDRAKRAELYKQIQQIFIDRGPIIVPYFETTIAATNPKVKGLVVHADFPRSTMRSVFIEG
ncbi:MAG: ABC transporter substrate-binding protein [Chloroflexi bacterium]|nr:ABC transporter substrate-binding protein [Chloroflexota bacterium]MCL5107935.1 ABC transporter substrate-binding protein [Chloroflexota bacterium]